MDPPLDLPALLESLVSSRSRLKYFPFVHIPEAHVREVCRLASEIFASEPSVLTLTPPLVICGDTHGQFVDTLRILEVSGDPATTRYLFLGDYVDRGAQSIENIMLLLTLKIMYPGNVFLLRGNHETEEISSLYGLRDECIKRYGFCVYSMLIAVFENLPFAAVVGGAIFCVHGGIPSSNCTIASLLEVQRPLDLNTSEAVTDLLWSDPSSSVRGFAPSPRGVSFLFGSEKARQFMKTNNLQMIVRSHEVCHEGVSFPYGKDGGLVTIFSASNYCGTMNSSAIMVVEENLMISFTIFQAQG